ncbi:MAG: beta-ketoacyl synthase N-terminal-like domain-containing protein [Candidatus Peribacteraceae bacterium]|nr:thiolase domain-containing protein [Candidatus Peribacteria bacterium]
MERDIFIIGSGQTPFGEWWDKGIRELADDAIEKALENAPCSAIDIDMVIVANMLAEHVSGQAHLGSMIASLLPHQPPAIRAEAACASGAVAMHTACSMLESGRARNILVVGVEKMTDADNSTITSALMGAADNDKDAPSGITFPGLFGLIASRYMHEYGLTREQLSCVSSLHHAQAMDNPNAQFRSPAMPDQVSASPLVADPLRLLDCSPISDGAAACILSTEHKSPLRLAASQITTDTTSITGRTNLTSFAATREAMEHALTEAAIERSDISTVELHDCFSIAAVISLEDLGFAEPGRGIELYQHPDPAFGINRSGGLKACGHPVGATGIKQVVEIGKQLLQSKKQWGLAQNFGGIGATCCIHIIENLSSTHSHV